MVIEELLVFWRWLLWEKRNGSVDFAPRKGDCNPRRLRTALCRPPALSGVGVQLKEDERGPGTL